MAFAQATQGLDAAAVTAMVQNMADMSAGEQAEFVLVSTATTSCCSHTCPAFTQRCSQAAPRNCGYHNLHEARRVNYQDAQPSPAPALRLHTPIRTSDCCHPFLKLEGKMAPNTDRTPRIDDNCRGWTPRRARHMPNQAARRTQAQGRRAYPSTPRPAALRGCRRTRRRRPRRLPQPPHVPRH